MKVSIARNARRFPIDKRAKNTDLFHPNGGHKHCGKVLCDGYAINALQEHVELHPLPTSQRRARQLWRNNGYKMSIRSYMGTQFSRITD